MYQHQTQSVRKTSTKAKQSSKKPTVPNRKCIAESSPEQIRPTTANVLGVDFTAIPVRQTSSVTIQPKLKIDRPDSPLEREADKVAAKIMRMPATTISKDSVRSAIIQRECKCDEEDVRLQRKESLAEVPTVTSALQSRIQSMKGGGQPLSQADRDFFEPRFGRSLENVRVHSGLNANAAAKSINARAFTLGNQIMFSSGEYRPSTESGRRLLAHELTHTLQQSSHIQRWAAPTDWLDYVGLAIDLGERIYIELAYEEGQEKDFQRFVNTLFFAIDLALAALPGAGGGGIGMRVSHGAAVAAWELVPASAKLTVSEEVAKKMGWTAAKATQMINSYFRESTSSEKQSGEKRTNRRGPSGKVSTKKYLRKRWDKGTFETVEKSIRYHVNKHGKGLSPVEYTQRAEKAFRDGRGIGQSTRDMQGRSAVKIVSETYGTGLFTPRGKIIWFHPKL